MQEERTRNPRGALAAAPWQDDIGADSSTVTLTLRVFCGGRRTARASRSRTASATEADLSEIATHAGMDRICAWRRVDRVPGRRLRRLGQSLGQRGLTPVESMREAVGYVFGQSRPRHDEAPRADGGQWGLDPGVGTGRDRERLEQGVLGLDAFYPIRVRHDEASAARRLGHRHESGPAESAAPERRHTPVLDHDRAVARAVEVHRLEIALLIQAEAVEHVTGQDHRARAARAEADRLAAP